MALVPKWDLTEVTFTSSKGLRPLRELRDSAPKHTCVSTDAIVAPWALPVTPLPARAAPVGALAGKRSIPLTPWQQGVLRLCALRRPVRAGAVSGGTCPKESWSECGVQAAGGRAT